MNKKETAAKFHSMGCNCAQAVACAFCADADTETMKSLTRRYGGGAYKYCGALMGAVTAMNYMDGAIDPGDPADMEGKNAVAAAELLESFRAKNGSVYCRELKGRDTGVPLRSCRGCVEDAAELLEESLRAAGRDLK